MSERDVMEYDVLTVGAGPAGLAFAIRLKQLKPELSVCVIEKSSTIGAHILSGAVIEPGPLDDLLPGWRDNAAADLRAGDQDEFWFLGKTGGFKLPIVPPQMHNHGNFIVSLGAMCAWLAPQAEALGVEIYPGFAAAEMLFDEAGAVCGVRIGDMGVARDGSHKAGLYAGHRHQGARSRVLGEGARGHLTKQLVNAIRARCRHATRRAIRSASRNCGSCRPGACRPGKIVHTHGLAGRFAAPMAAASSTTWTRTGSRWATSPASTTSIRCTQPYEAFQQWKNHPSVKSLLEGGSILSAGARAIVTGGYQSLPKVEMPGAMLIGDGAGLLNVPKIKGTHQAIRSGMMAAEHIAAHGSPQGWDASLRGSAVMAELKKVRNFKPGFKKGRLFGLVNAGWETDHRGPFALDLAGQGRLVVAAESSPKPNAPKRDYVERTLPPRDRLAGVYFAATEHDEDQPIHLHVLDTSICITKLRGGVRQSLHALLPGRRL